MTINASSSDDNAIRALTDAEVEATTGAGILGDIWNGIVSAVGKVINLVIGAFGGEPQPWRGPFGNPQQPGTPPRPL